VLGLGEILKLSGCDELVSLVLCLALLESPVGRLFPQPFGSIISGLLCLRDVPDNYYCFN